MTAIPQEELENFGETIERFNASPTDLTLALNLSRSFRFRELHDIALPFAIHGLAMADPSDELYFMLKAEVATSGYYSASPKMRELGHAACEELTLSRDCHPAARHVSFQNLFYYTKKLSEYAPSFSSEKLKIDVPPGYYPTNPSICRICDSMFINIRCVNYFTDEDEVVVLPTEERLGTRNFLYEVWPSQKVTQVGEILAPQDLPCLNEDMPLGVEDIRLFARDGDLWCIGTVVQTNSEKMAEMLVAKINSILSMVEWRVIKSPKSRHEKNWAPLHENRRPTQEFIHSYDPLYIYGDHLSVNTVPPIAAHTWSGSTQAIPFSWSGAGWLVMIHEKIYQPDMKFTRRWYQQRFAWYDRARRLRAISRRFQFDNGETEFPCGMCLHPDGKRLLISYGVLDREAWLGSISRHEVFAMLHPVT